MVKQHLIGYLDDVIRPLILILPKMGGYLIGDNKLSEKDKTILTKIENLQNIELNASLIYGDRYKKRKKGHIVIRFIIIFVV